MKKIIFLTLVLIMSVSIFSQQTKTTTTFTKKDYLQKSKNQNTAGGIMAGSGVLLILATVFIFNQDEVVNSSSQSGFNTGYSIDTNGFKVVTGIAGTMAILGSIPLFIASAKNKKKGIGLTFKNEFAPEISGQTIINKTVPSLSFKIYL